MIPAVMAIDPGVNGGIAIIDSNRVPYYLLGLKSSMSQRELVYAVRDAADALSGLGSKVCYIEKVGYMPRDGGKGANTFGRVDGLLRGAALAYELELREVSPVLWQSKLNCLSGGNKNVTKYKAQELFPNIKGITHATADALLIAFYGVSTLG